MYVYNDYLQMKIDFASQLKSILLHKGLTTVDELDAPRRQQVQFIQRFISQLDDYKLKLDKIEDICAVKSKILTACMYIISDEIHQTYTEALVPVFNPTRSEVFSALQVAMNITPSNQFEALCRRNMLDLLDQFIVHLIHVDGKLSKDLRLDHPFADIKDFNLESFLHRLIKLKAEASSELTKEQFARLAVVQKQATPLSVGPSLLSRFWSASHTTVNLSVPVAKEPTVTETKAGTTTTTTTRNSY